MVHNLTSADFDSAIATGKCVVDFWASWCGPCRMQGPILDQFAEENTQVKVCKVNVDEQEALAARFAVMSIPTLVYFEDGKQLGKAVGVQSADQIKSALGV